MREIKFRGKRLDTGKWIYGFVVQVGERAFIVEDVGGLSVEVDPETVGQYTALKDKSGKEIWEGDLLSVPYISSRLFEIFFVDGAFKGKHDISTSLLRTLVRENGAEIVGNIHDNPELLTAA